MADFIKVFLKKQWLILLLRSNLKMKFTGSMQDRLQNKHFPPQIQLNCSIISFRVMGSNISIIIPTYKRKKYVIALLESLKGKVPKGIEVLIVEQTQNNKTAFSCVAKKSHVSLKYFFLKKPSMTHARNIGIKNAKGEIVFFLDDDCLLKTKISSFINNFTNKKIVAVAGRSLAEGQKIESDRNNTGSISFFGSFSDGYSSKIPQYIDTVIGCNMAWRKDILQQLGGFDEQFTGNALREESDMSLRAKKNGYKVVFNPEVEVLHVRAESGGARKTEGRLQWYFDFFSNETYFFLKHRPWWTVPFIMTTRWEWAVRCMFGFGREVSIRSITIPLKGFLDGIRKYNIYKNENRS